MPEVTDSVLDLISHLEIRAQVQTSDEIDVAVSRTVRAVIEMRAARRTRLTSW